LRPEELAILKRSLRRVYENMQNRGASMNSLPRRNGRPRTAAAE
jgi:hypothetical protein